MAETTLTFSKPDVQPPVYVAGGFTDWAPVEMACEPTESTGSAQFQFSYAAHLQPGKYQYKFRLGPGDWWVLDESAPTEDDGSGNVNNILTVEVEKPSLHPLQPVQDAHQAPLNTAHQTAQTASVVNEESIGGEKPIATDRLNTHQEEAVPDFAPPPYSAKEDSAAPKDAAPLSSAAIYKSPFVADGGKGQPEPTGSGPSWLSQNMLLVVALVVVPVALSYVLYR